MVQIAILAEKETGNNENIETITNRKHCLQLFFLESSCRYHTFKPYMSMRHLDMDLNKPSGLENRGLLEKAVEEGFEMSTIKLLVQAHPMLLT